LLDSLLQEMENDDFKVKCDYVVVGGGIAGVSCVQSLRLIAPEHVSIILVTASELVKTVTELTHLTKLLSSFNVIEKSNEDWQNENQGVQLVRGYVTDVDKTLKTVNVESYGKIQYDKLCICTGGVPKLLTTNNEHVIGIRDTQSVVHFQEKLKTSTRVMVVGNGGIATEIVYELSDVDVIWAVKDSSISSVFVDPGAGEFLLKRLHEGKSEEKKPVKRMKFSVTKEGDSRHLGSALGPDWHKGFSTTGRATGKSVNVEYSVEISEILSPEEFKSRNLKETELNELCSSEWNVYISLTNGKIFGCDFVISATGVIPSGANLKHVVDVGDDGGILVDECLRTSAPDIYAAGDIITANWTPATHWFQMRLWTQARQMGIMAAKMMVAHSQEEVIDQDFCFEMFAHVTRFFDYKVVLLGLYNGQKLDNQYEVLLRVTPGLEYVKTVMKDGKMQGAVLIGETDLEETFENLILNQLDLSSYGEELLNPDIDIEDYFD